MNIIFASRIVWTRRWWSNQTILIQNWVLALLQPNTPSKCWTNSHFRNQLTPAPWTVGSATGNHKIRGEILFRRLCNSYSSHHWTPEEGWSCNGESAAKATCWLCLCHRPQHHTSSASRGRAQFWHFHAQSQSDAETNVCVADMSSSFIPLTSASLLCLSSNSPQCGSPGA